MVVTHTNDDSKTGVASGSGGAGGGAAALLPAAHIYMDSDAGDDTLDGLSAETAIQSVPRLMELLDGQEPSLAGETFDVYLAGAAEFDGALFRGSTRDAGCRRFVPAAEGLSIFQSPTLRAGLTRFENIDFGSLLLVQGTGDVQISGTTQAQIIAEGRNASIASDGPLTFIGGVRAVSIAANAGRIVIGAALVFDGAPDHNYAIQSIANGGRIEYPNGVAFSGDVTGKAFDMRGGSFLHLTGSVEVDLPGDEAGTKDTSCTVLED